MFENGLRCILNPISNASEIESKPKTKRTARKSRRVNDETQELKPGLPDQLRVFFQGLGDSRGPAGQARVVIHIALFAG